MAKNLLLYDKYNKVINTTMDVKGTTGYITIENLIPDTDYPEGEFYVGWEVEGKILPKATVPEFTTLRQMREKLVIVYFSDLTEQQLVDIKGDSAYKVALDNGFNGTQKEWLESLKGEPGEPGRQGDPGRDGVDITEGGSAYEIALAEGFQGTREEWLESLKGEPGEPGEKGDPGEDGFGVDGASAYEIALENGFVGNIQDFLDSLVGEPGKDGQDGNDGLSAYQIALDNGFTGTEQEWLETLKGGLTGTENWQKRKVTSDDGTVITVDKPNLNAPDTYFTNSGFYYVTTSTGFPEGVSANGYVTFLIRNPNYSIMTFQPYNSERVFTKAKLNGNWGYWNEIGGRKEDRITSDYVVEIVMNTIENEINILRSTINEDSMYSEIDYLSYIDSVTDTKYTVTTIPTEDSNGYPIKLNRGYANDDPNDGSLETAREFALRKNASFVTNASVFDTSTGKLLGRQMDNGTIINNTAHRENYTLTIDNDRTLNAIPSTTNLEDITTSIDALTAFFPIILNGEKVDPSVYSSIPNTGEKNPRQIIAQKEDGTILVISVQGRGINGQGMDYEDTYRICSELGVKFAYHLDGGGSMQTNVRGSIITNPIDENGTKERKVKDFLYVTISEDIRKNRSNQKEFSNHSKNISDIQVKMDKLSKDFANMGTIPNVGDFKDTATFVSDANTIRQSGMYWVTNATLNTPKDYSYGLFHWQVNPTSALQMIVPFHINLGETLIRRTNGSMDVWTSWRSGGKDTTNWQKSKLTEQNGDRIRLSDVDATTLPTGLYQIQKMKNAPIGFDNNTQYWNVDVTTTQDNTKNIKAVLTTTNKEYNKTIYQGTDQGWKINDIVKNTRNDFKLYTVPLMSPFNTANLIVMENNHIVTVRLQGKANSNTNNISDLDVVIGKLPAHIEYPKDFVRCTISSMTKGETEQFIGNLVIDTKGIITVKFNRSGTSNSYFGGSLSFPKGDNKNVAFNSTNTKVYDYPDPNVVSVQGSDYYDGYIFGAITRTKGNVTEIQVIDTNNTSSSFICTNQQDNFSTLVGHGNSLKVVDKINDEYLMYITMTDDPKIVPVFVNTTTKIARVGEGIKTMQDSGGSEKRIISIDRVDKVGSTYELYCLWYGIEFKYIISNIDTLESLKGEQVFKLPLERVIEDKKVLLNDDSNSIKIYQDNLLDGDTFYITQYGENSSAILEYRVENAMAKSTGKYWYNYRTDAERYEIESIFKINGELYASISQKLFNKSTYDTYVIKVTLNT
ncbi:phosphodiester glycosidase family protein [Staphylococcus phage ZCSS1]|nr:phosphodiester glycosidase family protein [Staphylococcus phage ZCSS1]